MNTLNRFHLGKHFYKTYPGRPTMSELGQPHRLGNEAPKSSQGTADTIVCLWTRHFRRSPMSGNMQVCYFMLTIGTLLYITTNSWTPESTTTNSKPSCSSIQGSCGATLGITSTHYETSKEPSQPGKLFHWRTSSRVLYSLNSEISKTRDPLSGRAHPRSAI